MIPVPSDTELESNLEESAVREVRLSLNDRSICSKRKSAVLYVRMQHSAQAGGFLGCGHTQLSANDGLTFVSHSLRNLQAIMAYKFQIDSLGSAVPVSGFRIRRSRMADNLVVQIVVENCGAQVEKMDGRRSAANLCAIFKSATVADLRVHESEVDYGSHGDIILTVSFVRHISGAVWHAWGCFFVRIVPWCSKTTTFWSTSSNSPEWQAASLRA